MTFVRIFSIDHYMTAPILGLDVTYSQFRGKEVKQVPVLRIFGSNHEGVKTCLHIHGVFPYLHIPHNEPNVESTQRLCYRLATSLDKAINILLGQADSNTQHVFDVIPVAGIPLYGYHSCNHQFLKIRFYNSFTVRKAAQLLQNGAILDTIFQPHDAHINYELQFMIDYNLHGMNNIYLSEIKYRRSDDASVDDLSSIPTQYILSENVSRTSTCKCEIDCIDKNILNVQDVINGKLTANPGILAIWEEERMRRRLQGKDLQELGPKSSQFREKVIDTDSEIYFKKRLIERLNLGKELESSNLSSTLSNQSIYPAEVPAENSQFLNASISHLVGSLKFLSPNNEIKSENSIINENLILSLTQNQINPENLDQLYDALMDLADDGKIDDDSILSQRPLDVLEDREISADDDIERESTDLEQTLIQNECSGNYSDETIVESEKEYSVFYDDVIEFQKESLTLDSELATSQQKEKSKDITFSQLSDNSDFDALIANIDNKNYLTDSSDSLSEFDGRIPQIDGALTAKSGVAEKPKRKYTRKRATKKLNQVEEYPREHLCEITGLFYKVELPSTVQNEINSTVKVVNKNTKSKRNTKSKSQANSNQNMNVMNTNMNSIQRYSVVHHTIPRMQGKLVCNTKNIHILNVDYNYKPLNLLNTNILQITKDNSLNSSYSSEHVDLQALDLSVPKMALVQSPAKQITTLTTDKDMFNFDDVTQQYTNDQELNDLIKELENCTQQFQQSNKSITSIDYGDTNFLIENHDNDDNNIIFETISSTDDHIQQTQHPQHACKDQKIVKRLLSDMINAIAPDEDYQMFPEIKCKSYHNRLLMNKNGSWNIIQVECQYLQKKREYRYRQMLNPTIQSDLKFTLQLDNDLKPLYLNYFENCNTNESLSTTFMEKTAYKSLINTQNSNLDKIITNLPENIIVNANTSIMKEHEHKYPKNPNNGQYNFSNKFCSKTVTDQMINNTSRSSSNFQQNDFENSSTINIEKLDFKPLINCDQTKSINSNETIMALHSMSNSNKNARQIQNPNANEIEIIESFSPIKNSITIQTGHLKDDNLAKEMNNMNSNPIGIQVKDWSNAKFKIVEKYPWTSTKGQKIILNNSSNPDQYQRTQNVGLNKLAMLELNSEITVIKENLEAKNSENKPNSVDKSNNLNISVYKVKTPKANIKKNFQKSEIINPSPNKQISKLVNIFPDEKSRDDSTQTKTSDEKHEDWKISYTTSKNETTSKFDNDHKEPIVIMLTKNKQKRTNRINSTTQTEIEIHSENRVLTIKDESNETKLNENSLRIVDKKCSATNSKNHQDNSNSVVIQENDVIEFRNEEDCVNNSKNENYDDVHLMNTNEKLKIKNKFSKLKLKRSPNKEVKSDLLENQKQKTVEDNETVETTQIMSNEVNSIDSFKSQKLVDSQEEITNNLINLQNQKKIDEKNQTEETDGTDEIITNKFELDHVSEIETSVVQDEGGPKNENINVETQTVEVNSHTDDNVSENSESPKIMCRIPLLRVNQNLLKNHQTEMDFETKINKTSFNIPIRVLSKKIKYKNKIFYSKRRRPSYLKSAFQNYCPSTKFPRNRRTNQQNLKYWNKYIKKMALSIMSNQTSPNNSVSLEDDMYISTDSDESACTVEKNSETSVTHNITDNVTILNNSNITTSVPENQINISDKSSSIEKVAEHFNNKNESTLLAKIGEIQEICPTKDSNLEHISINCEISTNNMDLQTKEAHLKITDNTNNATEISAVKNMPLIDLIESNSLMKDNELTMEFDTKNFNNDSMEHNNYLRKQTDNLKANLEIVPNLKTVESNNREIQKNNSETNTVVQNLNDIKLLSSSVNEEQDERKQSSESITLKQPSDRELRKLNDVGVTDTDPDINLEQINRDTFSSIKITIPNTQTTNITSEREIKIIPTTVHSSDSGTIENEINRIDVEKIATEKQDDSNNTINFCSTLPLSQSSPNSSVPYNSEIENKPKTSPIGKKNKPKFKYSISNREVLDLLNLDSNRRTCLKKQKLSRTITKKISPKPKKSPKQLKTTNNRTVELISQTTNFESLGKSEYNSEIEDSSTVNRRSTRRNVQNTSNSLEKSNNQNIMSSSGENESYQDNLKSHQFEKTQTENLIETNSVLVKEQKTNLKCPNKNRKTPGRRSRKIRKRNSLKSKMSLDNDKKVECFDENVKNQEILEENLTSNNMADKILRSEEQIQEQIPDTNESSEQFENNIKITKHIPKQNKKNITLVSEIREQKMKTRFNPDNKNDQINSNNVVTVQQNNQIDKQHIMSSQIDRTTNETMTNSQSIESDQKSKRDKNETTSSITVHRMNTRKFKQNKSNCTCCVQEIEQSYTVKVSSNQKHNKFGTKITKTMEIISQQESTPIHRVQTRHAFDLLNKQINCEPEIKIEPTDEIESVDEINETDEISNSPTTRSNTKRRKIDTSATSTLTTVENTNSETSPFLSPRPTRTAKLNTSPYLHQKRKIAVSDDDLTDSTNTFTTRSRLKQQKLTRHSDVRNSVGNNSNNRHIFQIDGSTWIDTESSDTDDSQENLLFVDGLNDDDMKRMANCNVVLNKLDDNFVMKCVQKKNCTKNKLHVNASPHRNQRNNTASRYKPLDVVFTQSPNLQEKNDDKSNVSNSSTCQQYNVKKRLEFPETNDNRINLENDDKSTETNKEISMQCVKNEDNKSSIGIGEFSVQKFSSKFRISKKQDSKIVKEQLKLEEMKNSNSNSDLNVIQSVNNDNEQCDLVSNKFYTSLRSRILVSETKKKSLQQKVPLNISFNSKNKHTISTSTPIRETKFINKTSKSQNSKVCEEKRICSYESLKKTSNLINVSQIQSSPLEKSISVASDSEFDSSLIIIDEDISLENLMYDNMIDDDSSNDYIAASPEHETIKPLLISPKKNASIQNAKNKFLIAYEYDKQHNFFPQPGPSKLHETKENTPTSSASTHSCKSDELLNCEIDSFYDQTFYDVSVFKSKDSDATIICSQNKNSSQLKQQFARSQSNEMQLSSLTLSSDSNPIQSQNKLQTLNLSVLNQNYKNITTNRLTKDGLIVLMPKYNPPTFNDIKLTLLDYNIPEVPITELFYSRPADVTARIEIGHKTLKIPSTVVNDLPEFVSQLQYDTIKTWREKQFLDLHSTQSQLHQIDRNVNIIKCFATNREILITPCMKPPTYRDTELWLRAKEYFKNEQKLPLKNLPQKIRIRIPASPGTENQMDGEISDDSISLSPCTPTASQESCDQENVLRLSPILIDKLKKRKLKNRRLRISLMKTFTEKSMLETIKKESNLNNTVTNVVESDENIVTNSFTSLDSYLNNTEHRNALFNSTNNNNLSCLITGVTPNNTYGFKASLENYQDSRAINKHQYLTVMIVEIHVKTRGDLRPDPNFDSLTALFYSIHNDVPENFTQPQLETGIICLKSEHDIPINKYKGIQITYAENELDIFELLIALFKKWDPDILVGYEIEMFSWGFILERGFRLDLNISKRLSRVPDSKTNTRLDDNGNISELNFTGRIFLELWRLMRHEIALYNYTFENVVYHVLHERLPKHTFKDLSIWYENPLTKWITVDYYLKRVHGIWKLLDQLDFIGRTSELARLFGIQFYEVLSRGSQFRVESMMLRLSKPLNYIPVSPSVKQRAKMKAPEFLPLIMEPDSKLYLDPIIVLDFQSLYPSMMIAYNYCFSTCLGRVDCLGQGTPFEFGATQLRVNPKFVEHLLKQNKLNISPCGAVFVDKSVRHGILPRMLKEILDCRLMVKQSMKENKNDATLQKVLHSRQLGLKLIANVTYGYTAANFSGRMPCVELGDSVVSKGRETLERAIKLVEQNESWRVKVVYGDTDSLFVMVPGRSRQDAFKIGAEIADAVTKDNPTPVKLKLEKIYQPCILQTKKRYVGYMYESPDQEQPTYDAKGIETVRRDGCPAVAKILEKTLRILFETKDMSLVKQYVCRQFYKLVTGRASIQDLIFAKEFRGPNGYRPGAMVPALELARRYKLQDPRAEPRRSERVPYIIASGPPGSTLVRLARNPQELLDDPALMPHVQYYITKVIIPPLNRCLMLCGADVYSWYNEMPRKQHLNFATAVKPNSKKSTIAQHFATTSCVCCGNLTRDGICVKCVQQPQATVYILQEKLRKWERTYFGVQKICYSCCGRFQQTNCISLDCPVLYRLNQAERDLEQVPYVRNLINEKLSTFSL